MRVLVTGGAGFIGSHIAEFYAKNGDDVTVFDNLSRDNLLGKGYGNINYNWNYLGGFERIKRIKGDVTNFEETKNVAKDNDVIIHVAAQTAVTASLTAPQTDFATNALGTFNVLEAARISETNPAIVYTSTNKVYGDNINRAKVVEGANRYAFDETFKSGVSEDFSIDRCEHTPYGCSKLAGDLYAQDYSKTYGLKTGVFRMSCIYGTRQFGVEDQGWVAWFTIATLTEKPITLYGDGKQVRDILYVEDLVRAFDSFIQRNTALSGEVFNIGGGAENTISLLELIALLEQLTGKRSPISYRDWRPSDQKVYVSNISKARQALEWTPKVNPMEGVKKLVNWVSKNKSLFN